ncbi:hydroxyacid dehydrogenase [Haloferula sp.]|uniref:hydroxyacid dehydrogenase n=1 Tax=Haloferula sp. TaxID=2497595 RepID=UPI0032A08D93
MLTPTEIDTFLVDGRLDSLKGLVEPCVVMDCEGMSADEWRSILSEHNPEILVAGWKTPSLPEDVLTEVAPALRYVCYLPGSIRKLVTRKMIEDGLLVSNWASSISRTVAECALLLALGCMRKASYWNEQMHNQGGWKDGTTQTQSLFERRIGIHGYGSVARALIPLLKPFTSKISAYSEGVPAEIYEQDGVALSDSLESLFSDNEVIFEIEALTPEREDIVDEAMLRRIPAGGTFINVARGALVNEDDLLKVAREGHIQVGLDVYKVEPLPADHGFRTCHNIMLLPHLGGPTTDRRKDAADQSLENLKRYKRGEPILSPVTQEIYDRST